MWVAQNYCGELTTVAGKALGRSNYVMVYWCVQPCHVACRLGVWLCSACCADSGSTAAASAASCTHAFAHFLAPACNCTDSMTRTVCIAVDLGPCASCGWHAAIDYEFARAADRESNAEQQEVETYFFTTKAHDKSNRVA